MEIPNTQAVILIIQMLCPHLQDMARRTENKVDDAVINLICALVSGEVNTDN